MVKEKLSAAEKEQKKAILAQKREEKALAKAAREEQKKMELDRERQQEALKAESALAQQLRNSSIVDVSGNRENLFNKLPIVSFSEILHFLDAKSLGAAMITSSMVNEVVDGEENRSTFRTSHLLYRLKGGWCDVSREDVEEIISTSWKAAATDDDNSVSIDDEVTSKLSKNQLKKRRKEALEKANKTLIPSKTPFTGYINFIEANMSLNPISAATSISLSPEHTLIKSGGSFRFSGGSGVKSFGVGKRGQLGHGPREDERKPKPIKSIGYNVRVVQVSAGGGLVRIAHSLLLCADGRVMSFGCGQYGALGHGYGPGKTLPDTTRPQFIEHLSDVRCICVSAGELHSAVVTDDGDVYTFGEGFCGQLGHGDKRPQLLPKLVGHDIEYEAISHVSCGSRHTIVVSEEGEMYTFGLGHFGALGREYTPFQYGANDVFVEGVVAPLGQQGEEVDAPPPTAFPSSPPFSPSSLSTSPGLQNLDESQLVNLDLLKNCTLDDTSDQCLPKIVDELKGVKVRVSSAGHRHSVCVDTDNHLYSWGSGTGGALGHGDTGKRGFPIRVDFFGENDKHDRIEIAKCSAGVDTTIVVTRDGDCYSWGKSKYGRIGHGNVAVDVTIPKKIGFGGGGTESEKKTFIVDAKTCYVHSAILTATGEIWGCGKVGINGDDDGNGIGINNNGGDDDDIVDGGRDGYPVRLKGINCWRVEKEVVEKAEKVEWTKYGKYETKGRSAMLAEADRWS